MACIAVIDDNLGTHEIVRHTTGSEHQVMPYLQGTLAVDFLRERKPDVAIISVDLSDIDGLDLIRAVSTLPDGPPVVGICGAPEPARIVATISAGAADVTARPLRAGELRRCITTAIACRRIVPCLTRDENPLPEMVGNSDSIARLRSQVVQYASTHEPVLVFGESGVGKELVASALHRLSARFGGPLEVRNCGAIPDPLIESELFGTESGAYTDAVRRAGAFELADGGTLFLDEIGDLSPLAQVKLLRALETGRFYRVGGTREIKSDIRIVAATNRDLRQGMKDGSFRPDLYYRVNVLRICVPPLRDRREDIPILVHHFLSRLMEQRRVPQNRAFGADALARLSAYDWPGNVRELRNVVHRAYLSAVNGTIVASDVTFG